MKLSNAIDYFYISIIADGLSSVTLVWYKQRLSRLLNHLGDVDIKTVTINDLRAFVAILYQKDRVWADNSYRLTEKRGLSVSTIHSYVRAVKRFFNWLEFDGYLTTAENPSIRLKKPKLPQGEQRNITEENFKALLSVVSNTRFPVRNRAMLLFLVDTGVRVGGLVSLQWSDIDLDNQSAYVVEKGRKARYVFFGDETASALNAWYAVPRRVDGDCVFWGSQGCITRSGVSMVLRRLKKYAGVSGRVNAHAFRHLFAKRYLKNGGDLATLADLMGHSDVLVTKNSYSIFMTDELHEKHKKHSNMGDLLA